jgi:two-component system sensor histidine kinase UhpB
VAQSLTTMLSRLEQFKGEQRGRVGVQLEIIKLQQTTRDVLNGVRQILMDLRDQPSVMLDLGSRLRDELAPAFEARTGITITVRVSPRWPEVISSAAARQLLGIINETLNNIHLHSGARSIGVYLLARGEDELVVLVKDDGRGFRPSSDSRQSGLGLLGIKERALLLGGNLTVSSQPGRGSTLRVTVPRRLLTQEQPGGPDQPEPSLKATLPSGITWGPT